MSSRLPAFIALLAVASAGCLTVQVEPGGEPAPRTRFGRTLVVADFTGWGAARDEDPREEQSRARIAAEDALVRGLRGWHAVASHELLRAGDTGNREELARRALKEGFDGLLVLSLDREDERQKREVYGEPRIEIRRPPGVPPSSGVAGARIIELRLKAALVSLGSGREIWTARATARDALLLAESVVPVARKVARTLAP